MSARKKISRTNSGTVVENNPSIQEIIADLSNGHHKSFLIYVEDSFSQKMLIELVRNFKPELLNAISVAPVGDKDDVKWAVKKTSLHKDLTVIGVRDEDHTKDISQKIFAYPTDLPPEKEVFSSPAVSKYLQGKYGVCVSEVLGSVKDHHDYSGHIADICRVGKETIEVQSIQAFVESKEADKYKAFVEDITKECK